MSYDIASSANSQLTRSSGTIGRISMAWVRYLEYVVGAPDSWIYLPGFGNDWGSSCGDPGSIGGVQTSLYGFSQSNIVTGAIESGSNTSWVFICMVETDSVGLTVYYRHEGDTALSNTSLTDAGLVGAGEVILGTSFFGSNHKRITAYKEWTNPGDLTSAQILAESTQHAPIVTTNNINYLQCDAGHTVGVDQSAAAQNWTVTGTTITTNADEPNMSTGGLLDVDAGTDTPAVTDSEGNFVYKGVNDTISVSDTAFPQIYRIAIRGTATTSASSGVCNKPTGVVAGDVLVAFTGIYDPNVTSWASSGWTLLAHTSETGGPGGSDLSAGLLYKVAGGSEPSSYTFTKTGGIGNINVIMCAYSGVYNSVPFETSSSVNNSAGNNITVTGLSITAAATDMLVYGFFGDDEFFVAQPSGSLGTLTPRIDAESFLNLDIGVSGYYDGVLTATGSTGNYVTTTQSADTWIVLMGALRTAGTLFDAGLGVDTPAVTDSVTINEVSPPTYDIILPGKTGRFLD